MKNVYTEEHLQMDIAWLEGYGVPSKDAERFIEHLLSCEEEGDSDE